MNFVFSDNMTNMKPSAVGKLLKQMSDPSIIGFSGGNPAQDSFPIEEIKEISNNILANDAIATLQYGMTTGYAPLKKAAIEYFSTTENVYNDYDDIMMTSGSMQIVDLVTKCLCNAGDTVVCEDPSFVGALDSIRSYGVKLVGVPVQEDGIDIAKLEEALSAPKKPKFIYLIPNFQNPTGVTLSLEKRIAIYDLAVKYSVPILEDNPYGALRFSGEDIKSIKSLDKEGAVIYAASFSKILCPGIRVAACIASKDLIAKMTTAKQGSDVHSTTWSQRVCCDFLKMTDMEKHLGKLSNIYGDKYKLMASEMTKHFPKEVSWIVPEGGMFIWVKLPDTIDMPTFVQKAIDKKVAVVPGNAFFVDDEAPCQCIRTNFSTPTKEDILKGVAILGEVMREMI